jgi:hypothetical protein
MSMATRLAAVETKVQCVSADSDDGDFIPRGCNVHVQNAAAEVRSGNPKVLDRLQRSRRSCGGGGKQCTRTGSHNLVLGPNAYSGSGGIVSGTNNTLTVLGCPVWWAKNVADQWRWRRLRWKGDTASGGDAVVDGGHSNKATTLRALLRYNVCQWSVPAGCFRRLLPVVTVLQPRLLLAWL